MTNAEQLIAALESAGYTWRRYSGRGMYGKECVGVTLSDDGELFDLGRTVGAIEAECNPGHVRTDNMGRGIIVYWPGAEL